MEKNKYVLKDVRTLRIRYYGIHKNSNRND